LSPHKADGSAQRAAGSLRNTERTDVNAQRLLLDCPADTRLHAH
jgi:hypothetical protein